MEIISFVADFENLPKKIQRQLIEYAEFLMSRSRQKHNTEKKKNSFSFSWEDGLTELKDQYTSVELQHSINELR